MKKRTLAAVSLVFTAACATETSAPPAMTEVLPVTAAAKEQGELVPGQYIVVFNEDVKQAKLKAKEKADKHGGKLKHAYEHAIRGFSAELSAEALVELAKDKDVAYIEQDRVIRLTATQTGATWGLDRVDQRNLPLSTTYTYAATGSGVTAYIIDTGILLTHSEFGGRASSGFDAVTSGGGAIDCNGHGTHVAGTVGGATHGVAKSVSLVAVRVLDCAGSGTTAGVIAGIDWVTANHTAGTPAVANMSLGGGASSALDAAVSRSIADGVTYAIAAGNGNFLGFAQDACRTSPARVGQAITVSATDKSDRKASWANFGTCLDIFAPGVGITSSWYTGATATSTISGTSMAAPHVAGVAALYLQGNGGASPQQVRDALVAAATTGKVTSPGRNSPNRLLFSAY
jgi:subtilisin family serine protease